MRFEVTVIAHYDVADERLFYAYGTKDPERCAQIDSDNDLADILAEVTIDSWSITPKV